MEIAILKELCVCVMCAYVREMVDLHCRIQIPIPIGI